jgi:hypothetical protein
MVSLRYHLVSLGAALMALAAGVVLGAGPLSTTVNHALADQTSTTNGGASSASVAALRAQAAFDDTYAAATAAALVAGRLRDRHVVLIVSPGVTPYVVRAVTATLSQAGATITGPVTLTAAWQAPTQQAVLAGITSQLSPTAAPAGAPPADATAAALASALVSPHGVTRPADAATALLAGLVQGGFVVVTGQPAQAATMAVLLVPAGSTSGSSSTSGIAGASAQGGLLPLARALATNSAAAVVAGPRGSAAGTGLLGVLRSATSTAAAARAVVSGIDNVDLVPGRVALVLALVQEASPNGGHGQYGQGPGADAPLPSQR